MHDADTNPLGTGAGGGITGAGGGGAGSLSGALLTAWKLHCLAANRS